MTTFTDAEHAFADSAEGRRALAMARRRHDTREAHRGRAARPWTDAMEADAVRVGAVANARANLHAAQLAITAPRELATATAVRDTARMMRDRATRAAWKR